MPRLIDADAKITALLYDEEHEETKEVKMSIADFLDSHTVEGCPQNGGWISVKDRLPERAGIYIICDHYGNVMSRLFCKSHVKFAGYWHLNGSAKYGNPRYWMSLPEPPKTEK